MKRIVDAILVLVAAEAVCLPLLHRLTGRGMPAAILWPNLVAGASLLTALRLALRGAAPAPVCASLVAAGLAHAADLRRHRWRIAP